MDVKQAVSEIGRARLREALEVSDAAIGNAISRGVFPAGWLLVVQDLGAECGIDVPASLFNLKSRGGQGVAA